MSAGTLDIQALPRDTHCGANAMTWLIVTEVMLFVALFFSYFLLGSGQAWPPHDPPRLPLAIVMLVLLLGSSAVLEGARHFARAGYSGRARMSVLITVLMGCGFLALQVREFREHLKTLTPGTDAYGSIFYTITSIHGVHVALGIAMLLFVVVLPRIGPATTTSPHRPLHVATLYWHFVDAVWCVLVALLYALPHWGPT